MLQGQRYEWGVDHGYGPGLRLRLRLRLRLHQRRSSCAVNGTAVGGAVRNLGEYLSVAGQIHVNKWSLQAGIALRRRGMLEGEMLGQAHADWAVRLVPVIYY